jgi:hypothetical protein
LITLKSTSNKRAENNVPFRRSTGKLPARKRHGQDPSLLGMRYDQTGPIQWMTDFRQTMPADDDRR